MPSSSPLTKRNNRFSQKHPFLFGLTLILAAMILLAGVMAAFRHFSGGSGGSGLDFDGDKLGVVRIQGMLTGSEKINAWIRELRDDNSVKGVLLRVNCPGGAVAPSQEIYHAVRRLAEAKPVVVSMSTVAASGGYYVSAPAHMIVANPSTLTGSIGVIMEMSNLVGLFEKLGIERQALTSGALKDAGSPFRAMTPEDRAYLMGLIGDIHEQFVSDVAEGRGMDIETIRPIADGRALTGNQALKAGLVDKLGGFEDAIAELKALCGKDPNRRMPVVEGPEEEKPWLRRILGAIEINVNASVPDSSVVIR